MGVEVLKSNVFFVRKWINRGFGIWIQVRINLGISLEYRYCEKHWEKKLVYFIVEKKIFEDLELINLKVPKEQVAVFCDIFMKVLIIYKGSFVSIFNDFWNLEFYHRYTNKKT